MWRSSWRVLSQVRRSTNLPPLSCPPCAHLGLQRLRLRSPTLNGSFAPDFSTAAEAANMANSAEADTISSVDRVEMEMGSTDDSLTLKFEGEQGENALTKIIEEHRQLVATLRAELDEQKTLTRSILDEIRVLTLKSDTKSAEAPPPEKKLPSLEWTAFMEHLQDSGYFKVEKRAPPPNGGGSIFEDLTCVKKAIHRFSQAHDSIFQSLSQIDLRIIARYGCVGNDSDAAASQKKLRQHFHLEDILTEDAGDKSANIQPELLDVTRLMHCSIVEGTIEEDVRLSISHLLREIITLSRKSTEASPPTSLSPSSLDIIEGANRDKANESSKTDKWKASKEERIDVKRLNTPLVEGRSNLGRVEARLETTAPTAPDWKCPRCSFMNLDTKHRCVECSRRRPQRTYAANAVKSSDDVCLVDEDTEERANTANEKKVSLPSSPVQGRGSLKGPPSSLATSDTESDQSGKDDGDKNAEAKGPFDVLDDILESSDSDEDEEFSEEAKEKTRGSGKKSSSLSGLFTTRPSKWEMGRKNNAGTSGRRPLKDSLPKSRDSNRHLSLGTDEEESSLSDTELPSRKGNDYGDDEGYSRRPRREKFNSSRGGGGGRGYRGESFDDRYRDRSPRGAREFGDRDRGSRSDNFGSRFQKGRSRY